MLGCFGCVLSGMRVVCRVVRDLLYSVGYDDIGLVLAVFVVVVATHR